MSILFSGRRRWSAWCVTLALLVAVGVPVRAQPPGYGAPYGPTPGYGSPGAGEPTSFGPAQSYMQTSPEMAAPGVPSTPQAPPPPMMGPPGAGPMAGPGAGPMGGPGGMPSLA